MNKHLSWTPIKSGISLLVFTVICIALVSMTHIQTKARITYNIEQTLIKQLNKLAVNYDNDLLASKTTKTLVLYNVSQVVDVYTAKQNGQIFAYLVKHTYPQGYSGDIILLSALAVKDNQLTGQLLGTRVISHKETPGLGDGINETKSDWILQFDQQALINPTSKPWQLKKQGGQFDALTGATISSNAVMLAIFELLMQRSLINTSPDTAI